MLTKIDVPREEAETFFKELGGDNPLVALDAGNRHLLVFLLFKGQQADSLVGSGQKDPDAVARAIARWASQGCTLLYEGRSNYIVHGVVPRSDLLRRDLSIMAQRFRQSLNMWQSRAKALNKQDKYSSLPPRGWSVRIWALSTTDPCRR
jgi:hypothetical protein